MREWKGDERNIGRKGGDVIEEDKVDRGWVGVDRGERGCPASAAAMIGSCVRLLRRRTTGWRDGQHRWWGNEGAERTRR